jgi:hypothetical protein
VTAPVHRLRPPQRAQSVGDAFPLVVHGALQFHPEVTPEIVARWSERYRPEHPEIDYGALARDGEAIREAAGPRAFALFDRWWEWLASRRSPAISASRW